MTSVAMLTKLPVLAAAMSMEEGFCQQRVRRWCSYTNRKIPSVSIGCVYAMGLRWHSRADTVHTEHRHIFHLLDAQVKIPSFKAGNQKLEVSYILAFVTCPKLETTQLQPWE